MAENLKEDSCNMMGRLFISLIKNSGGRQSRQAGQHHGHQGPMLLCIYPDTLRVWRLSLRSMQLRQQHISSSFQGQHGKREEELISLLLEAFWKFHITPLFT